jgi:hypothetical protein
MRYNPALSWRSVPSEYESGIDEVQGTCGGPGKGGVKEQKGQQKKK